ncbi:MAG: PfkB family carbohydrate kinase [Hyphomonas sp.]
MPGRIICFGELLLRLTAPRSERLLQSPHLDVFYGGAEANLAVSLARFGHDAKMISAVPNNPLGNAILSALKAQGVDVSCVQTGDGRMGTYYFENGAVTRPSRIVYDRAASTFALSGPDAFDWPTLTKDADWLHLSGITPAVGPGPAYAALAAIAAAREAGTKVSFDGNYREALWKSWGGNGPVILKQILAGSDIAFINERDISLLLGRSIKNRTEAIALAFEYFPNLQTIATTLREQDSVTDQKLTGEIFTRTAHHVSKTHNMPQVTDRIGGGDAFAAGVLHGLIENMPLASLIEFATAASALKHSILGDWNLTTVAEVNDAMTNSRLDVRR